MRELNRLGLLLAAFGVVSLAIVSVKLFTEPMAPRIVFGSNSTFPTGTITIPKALAWDLSSSLEDNAETAIIQNYADRANLTFVATLTRPNATRSFLLTNMGSKAFSVRWQVARAYSHITTLNLSHCMLSLISLLDRSPICNQTKKSIFSSWLSI